MPLASGRYENWHQWQSVVYGVDALGCLPAELERLKARRVLLVTTPSLLRQGAVLEAVRRTLGGRHAGTFGECRQYVPRSAVLAAARAARAAEPDLLLSVGGGSVVDTAKGVALVLREGLEQPEQLDDYRARTRGGSMETPSLSGAPLPIFAFPTTLSGAEYTGMIGITNEKSGEREPFRDDRLSPATVFLDPAVAAATPERLWAATGIKSLSDAFEQYCAGMAGPVMEPLTLRAFAWLIRHLPASLEGDVDARLHCQVASWLTLYGVFNAGTRVGIGAAIRHQLAMLHGIPHGEASCGILAEVVRRTAPSDRERLVPLLHAAGIPVRGDAEAERGALAARLADLLRQLRLPGNLSGLGIRAGDLDALAGRVAGDFAARARTARAWTVSELRELLGSALG